MTDLYERIAAVVYDDLVAVVRLNADGIAIGITREDFMRELRARYPTEDELLVAWKAATSEFTDHGFDIG